MNKAPSKLFKYAKWETLICGVVIFSIAIFAHVLYAKNDPAQWATAIKHGWQPTNSNESQDKSNFLQYYSTLTDGMSDLLNLVIITSAVLIYASLALFHFSNKEKKLKNNPPSNQTPGDGQPNS